MDGVLLIDKPSGLTSHDVVAWARRRLGQRAIGHAGTLDPMATGLLLLLVGKATRLASLLTGTDKTYEAVVRLGVETDTADAEGVPLGPPADRLPTDEKIRLTMAGFVGTGNQVPPAHSAKKVAGTRSYLLARRAEAVTLPPVEVTVRSIEWHERVGDQVSFRVTATAGFYVRALARDIGRQLGCGGHLTALRRVRSGSFSLRDALDLAGAEALGEALAERLIRPALALPDLPAVQVTAAGLTRVLHGRLLDAEHFTLLQTGLDDGPGRTGRVAVLAPDGHLVALADWQADALHPATVLG